MESTNLSRLIDLFGDHELPYVVIGGYAVNFYGHIRATEDVDIVFQRTSKSETSLFQALKKINAKWIGDETDPETGLERLHNVSETYIRDTHLMMLETDLGFVDLFDFIPGYANEPVEQLLATAETCSRGKFVSLRWLRKMKAASGRPIDLIDLQNLPQVDLPATGDLP